MPIYLGFDSSTQGLTVMAIEVEPDRRRVLFEHNLEFETDFPEYGTRHGALPNGDPATVHAPPLMWAAALDRMLGIVSRDGGFDVGRLRAIAGSAQQHGSVYLRSPASSTLPSLTPAQPLASQISPLLSRNTSPIWMDSSTSRHCAEITAALGGQGAVARLTGSRAFERFTGPQIRKFFEQDPEGYRDTNRIHLVSSFLATLLTASDAPIDHGDGAGMSLMDISRWQWSPAAVRATAPELERRLPPLMPSWTVAGQLAPYWRSRHGLPPCRVIAWSGDNPCSVVGTGLVQVGRIAASLGTSDTVFAPMASPTPDPTGAGCVYGSPTGGWMGLTGFRNGSLARERIRDEHGLDWSGFSQALQETRPGNRGAILLPWFEPEITPTVHSAGVRRYGLSAADATANVRAVVEGQMMALRSHSDWMGVRPHELRATGGASANTEILQVMADVFDAPVMRFVIGNSACLGAALRAWHADELADGESLSWEEIVRDFVIPAAERITPIAANVECYAKLLPIHAACEAHALGTGPDPTPMIAAFRAAAGASS